MKTLGSGLVLLLVLVATASVSAAGPGGRLRFRATVDELSARSIRDALHCEAALKGGEPRAFRLILRTRTNEDYRDAFMIDFESSDSRVLPDFSTLVAYEGFNGTVLGELRETAAANRREFIHTFNGGFSQDIVTLLKSGESITFQYEKKRGFKTIERIVCQGVRP